MCAANFTHTLPFVATPLAEFSIAIYSSLRDVDIPRQMGQRWKVLNRSLATALFLRLPELQQFAAHRG